MHAAALYTAAVSLPYAQAASEYLVCTAGAFSDSVTYSIASLPSLISFQ